MSSPHVEHLVLLQSNKQLMFCRLTKCILLKYMFTMLNRQTQSKNAKLEFTYKEIQLYFVRTQTVQGWIFGNE
jgi:hypothetical protein